MENPKFSLVVCTLGRADEFKRLFDSLQSQTCRDFEVIVVDQNKDDRIERALKDYLETLTIVHLRSEPGLSRARNVGLKAVRGDIVAFPDDDCWYPAHLLETTIRLFDSGVDGLGGRCLDASGDDCGLKLEMRDGPINRFNVWRRGNSSSMFFRREVIEKVGEFDESLGLGSGTPWGAGEDIDYLIRALQNGSNILYLSSFYVHHPKPNPAITTDKLRRIYSYGAGAGRVLQKHHYPLWFKAKFVFVPLAGTFVSLASLNHGQARVRWNRCLGQKFGLMAPTDTAV
jgi:glycosyltransferase involved in cell wall biosynthesis